MARRDGPNALDPGIAARGDDRWFDGPLLNHRHLGVLWALLGRISRESERQGNDDDGAKHGKAFLSGWPSCRAVFYSLARGEPPGAQRAPSIIWMRCFVGFGLAPKARTCFPSRGGRKAAGVGLNRRARKLSTSVSHARF